jgi:cytoplasmic tRNA 2-thiolation protein 2
VCVCVCVILWGAAASHQIDGAEVMSRCFKCRQGIGAIASRDGPKTLYCADCFLGYVTGAVRDNLFQQCFLASDTPVAVAVSGGPNSLLLLRELGQLRRKMQDQRSRPHAQQQQQIQQQRLCHNEDAATDTTHTQPSSYPPAGTTLELLPFHLCEAELVLPPSLPSATTDEVGATMTMQKQQQRQQKTPAVHHGRQAAVERVRASMQGYFDLLLKLVQQQPPLWVYHDQRIDEKKGKKKRSTNTCSSTVPTQGASCSDETKSPVYLFSKSEVRIFQYSDFLPPAYIRDVRAALHASKLSLTDREALYDRVKRQVLCRAAQRVITEFVDARHPPATVESSGTGNSVMQPHAANTVPCHLVVGDNAARCAVSALEAVVTGAGGDGVVHAAAFRGFLHNVVCLRPMRTILPKEAVLSSRLHGITSSYTPALTTGTSLRSVQHVLEEFVYTMISSHRTMIFNVLNTVQKLRVHPESIEELVKFVRPMKRDCTAEEQQQQQVQKPTQRKQPLPGRTAQQNQRDLNSVQPPVICHRPSGLAAEAMSTQGSDGSRETPRSEVAVQCCVCGCPASLPSCSSGEESSSRQVEMFAVEDPPSNPRITTAEITPASSSVNAAAAPKLDAFVCYACRSLLEAWPASTFLQEGGADALRAACSLFSAVWKSQQR